MLNEKRDLTKKTDDVSGWYNDIVLRSELADYGPAKGTMVFRPYGYAIWEKVQEVFNKVIKEKGVQNAYFPMFIPYSLLEKESEHVEGFSPELAIVTIGGGEELKEKLVVRPTSETIMYSMWSKWYQSWRDFPVLMNQWANVVRWEKRTYLFMRTSEFLWQEGHTAHTTQEEARDMTLWALDEYRKLYEDYFAIAGVAGVKSESEKFAGADKTYTIELLMPDGKALQAGTSHELGQNFAKAFDFTYSDKEGKAAYPWQTSWGLSTRSLGGLVLAHGDDNGLKLPPKLAPIQVVIVPIIGKEPETVIEYAKKIHKILKDADLRCELDLRDYNSGYKYNYWELKGVPVRLELGQREAMEGKVTVATRDDSERVVLSAEGLATQISEILDKTQMRMLENTREFLKQNTHVVDSYDDFKKIMAGPRGFLSAFWCESRDCEKKIKEETKASTRCLPLNVTEEKGKCIYCGEDAHHRWLFAQAY